jgi:hypothetical protein
MFNLYLVTALITSALTIVYDMKIAKRITGDGIFMSCFFAWELSNAANAPTAPTAHVVLAYIFGMAFASLQRFIIGYILHSVKSKKFQEDHESFHNRLRQRKLYGMYERSDDLHEIVSYTILILFWKFLGNVIGIGMGGASLWLGIATEHYFGQLLRIYIQFIPRGYIEERYTSGAYKWKFLRNAEAFYYYHIMVNPLACFGFSAPFWDTISGRNPASTGTISILWSWFPWIDFLITDYSKLVIDNEVAWTKYSSNITKVNHDERLDNSMLKIMAESKAEVQGVVPLWKDMDEPGVAEVKHRDKQALFLLGRKLQLIADRYPNSNRYADWSKADEKQISEAVDHILNQTKMIRKVNRSEPIARAPKRRTNGADTIVVCPKDLTKVDIKDCRQLGRDWQYLLDTCGKRLQSEELASLSFAEIKRRSVEKREKIASGYYKTASQDRSNDDEDDDEYTCECGRSANCNQCGQTFCYKLYGEHCWKCESGICGKCKRRGYTFSCDCFN